MSKIKNALSNKKSLITYITAGDPSIESTEQFIFDMASAGVDLIEIGIPFSDPVAEGPVIERANLRALEKRITIDNVFNMIKNVRKKTDIPLVLLTYINPVFVYGYELFFEKCNEIGVDGIIIPDLPFEEQNELLIFSKKNNVNLISLIAPNSGMRIEKISKNAEGFIYLASSLGVTGIRSEILTDLKKIIENIRQYSDIPVGVGFGISTKEQAHEISRYCDAIIVGSAVVKIIEEHKENASQYLIDYILELKKSLK